MVTIIIDQSGHESNGNKRVLPRSPELEPYNQIQFTVMPFGRVLDN